jgi:radical SAM protein with 4Fe4S-binding SPASM domain
MAYAKYQVKKSGIQFYSCNQTNRLFEADGSPLVTQWGGIGSDIGYETQKGVRKKSNQPLNLRIILGHACNYDCSYCMQKDIGNPNERPQNKSLDTFINTLSTKLDLSKLHHVQLWGGEPFLYWNDMVVLMNFFDKPGMTFLVSTNGSTFMDKHIEFFNTLKGTVRLSISHDGPAQKEQRGEEIFDKDRVQRVIKKIDESYPKVEYFFHSVLTNNNYDLFKINDFFADIIKTLDLHNARISCNIARTYHEHVEIDHHYSFSDEMVISGKNLQKFQKMLNKFYKLQINQYKEYVDKMQNNEDSYYGCKMQLIPHDMFVGSNLGSSVLGYINKTVNGEPIISSSTCGADSDKVISIDLDGNIRTCPHASGDKHSYGHVSQLKGIRILSMNLARKNDHCEKCPNLKLCKGSCPIDLPDQSFNTNCAIEKIWYHERQKAAFSLMFNGEVELLTDLYSGGISDMRLF